MTLQTRSALTHPQLPSTSSDWSNFSHELHSVLKGYYGTNVKPGKILNAISQAAKFSNAHEMQSKLDSMHSAIRQELSVAFKISDQKHKQISKMTNAFQFKMDVSIATTQSLDFYKSLILQVMLGDKTKFTDNKATCLSAVDFGTLPDIDSMETMAIEQSHHIDGDFDNVKLVSTLEKLLPEISLQAKEAVKALQEMEGDSAGYDNSLQYRIEFLRALAITLVLETSLQLKFLIKKTFNLNEDWLEKARTSLIAKEQEKNNMAMLIETAAEKAIIAFFKVMEKTGEEQFKILEENVRTEEENEGIHTLVYSERTTSSDALCTMNGPTVHNSRKEAVRELFSYVKNRIVETCPDAFVEMIEEKLEVEFNLKKHSEFEKKSGEILDKPLTMEEQESHVKWFFEMMSDETVECYYKITKH